MKKLKFIILSLITLLSFNSAGLLAVSTASAIPRSNLVAIDTTDACSGLSQLDSSTSCGSGGSGVNKLLSTVVTIISYIAGVIAIIMIIISGLRYITSSGESSKVGAAKNSLIYALIGIAIVVLAQFLIHFVINSASKA